ncbi:MAG: 50S ribosomal protein L22 [Acidobacteriota bacterium]|nr:50S ribosomal protein L22 [Acidobacteriota bacterium]MDE3139459.1 50S ribosomal protein L22 [Acidobacteriota bacterium]
MTGPKTNERPGTRATLRGYHMSASKARVVLNLIRGEDVKSAAEILAGTTREAADVIAKVLASAVANAVNNDSMDADELYVSAAYADEGITMKRFTPRARGRAGQIRKRACHITVIVSRLDEDRLELLRVARSAQAAASRSRRVATSRRRSEPAPATTPAAPAAVEEVENDLVVAEVETTEPEIVEETVNDQALDETSAEETVSEDTTEETK